MDTLGEMFTYMQERLGFLRKQDEIDVARIAGEWLAAPAEQMDSHEEFKKQPKTYFDTVNPDTSYNQPRTDVTEQITLMETGRDGAAENEGWLKYQKDAVQTMVIKDTKVALARRRFKAQTSVNGFGKADEKGLWEFARTQISKDTTVESTQTTAKRIGQGLASPKYHDKSVITLVSEDETVLQGTDYEWFDVSSPKSIDALVETIMSDCDPSVIAGLYRYKMTLEGKAPARELPKNKRSQDQSVHISTMQDTTPNWFSFRSEKNEDGDWEQYCTQGKESFGIGMLNQNTVLLMVEESPAGGYVPYTTAVSGGWKESKEPKPGMGAVRELQEEVGYTGEATTIGVMHPNPDSQNTVSVVNIVTNVHKYTGEAQGDEVTKIQPRILTRQAFDAAIEKGEIIDDRTIAAVYMAFVYAERHPEAFQKKTVTPTAGERT